MGKQWGKIYCRKGRKPGLCSQEEFSPPGKIKYMSYLSEVVKQQNRAIEMNGVDGKIAEGQRSETEEQHVKGEDSSQYLWIAGIQLC